MRKIKYEAPEIDITMFVPKTSIMDNPNEGNGNIINVHGTSEVEITTDDFDPSLWNIN